MSDGKAIALGYLQGSGGTVMRQTCANESTTPCAPTAGSNPTVAAGSTQQTYCTTLASYTAEPAIGIDAANACRFGTTDGCSYITSTHTMNCPGQPAVMRPAAAAWDSGAYQFLGLASPRNITGTVVVH
jgi:hypothetical protein